MTITRQPAPTSPHGHLLKLYSLSGAFRKLSKLVVVIVMLRGRHRGLPVAIDRAVMLPRDFTVAEEQAIEERVRRMSRRGSMDVSDDFIASLRRGSMSQMPGAGDGNTTLPNTPGRRRDSVSPPRTRISHPPPTASNAQHRRGPSSSSLRSPVLSPNGPTGSATGTGGSGSGEATSTLKAGSGPGSPQTLQFALPRTSTERQRAQTGVNTPCLVWSTGSGRGKLVVEDEYAGRGREGEGLEAQMMPRSSSCLLLHLHYISCHEN